MDERFDETGLDLPWGIDAVFEEFLEILNGWLVDQYTFEDEKWRDALIAVERMRKLPENNIANTMYDPDGVNLVWLVDGEIRSVYLCAECCMDVKLVVSEVIDISVFMERWPHTCDGMVEPLIGDTMY